MHKHIFSSNHETYCSSYGTEPQYGWILRRLKYTNKATTTITPTIPTITTIGVVKNGPDSKTIEKTTVSETPTLPEEAI